VSDRFYRALYAALLAEGARAGSKAPQFLALLFKAMKADPSAKRWGGGGRAARRAYKGRLPECLWQQPPMLGGRRWAWHWFCLTVPLRALVPARRCAAFAKRLLQVCADAPPSWAAGALLLLSEVLKAQPALWSGVQQPEEGADDEERFMDVDTDDEEDKEDGGAAAAAAAKRGAKPAGAKGGRASGGEQLPPWPREGGYDMRKRWAAGRGAGRPPVLVLALWSLTHPPPRALLSRSTLPQHAPHPPQPPRPAREPLYSEAERACWWELLPLASHAHPSVAAFARSLLAGSHIVYDGDPLRELTLPAFLDKFIQRKPKVGGAAGGCRGGPGGPLQRAGLAASPCACLTPR
jgi:ribosome biogenesis protein MAK21